MSVGAASALRRAQEQLAAREALTADREHDLATTEQHLSEWNERLRTREEELRTREQRVELATKLFGPRVARSAGTNADRVAPASSRCDASVLDRVRLRSVAGLGCESVEDRLGEPDADDFDTVGGYVRAEPFDGEADTGCGGCAEESFQIAEGCPGGGTGGCMFEE